MKSAILKHPLTLLSGAAAGVLIGLYNAPISAVLKTDNFARVISFPGQLYLFFLQMTAIPIIITAIASSLGKLMLNKNCAGLIKKLVFVFLICMFICSLTGAGLGIFGKPGADDILEIALDSSDRAAQNPGIGNFFVSLLPSNIFQALSPGSIMAIVFFSIILGLAIGLIQEQYSIFLTNIFTAISSAFQKLISWALYLLPFGLICLLAGQIAALKVQLFVVMSKFILLYLIGAAFLFLICTIIILIRYGNPNPFKAFSALIEPVLLSFVSCNSMAVLPSAITCLDDKLKFNSTAVNLTMPLGMTFGRFGNIFYFALTVFFTAQIYNIPLEPIQYLVIIIGVIFAGTVTAGTSGIVTLSLLSIILDPSSLSLEAALIFLIAIDSIIDPFRAFLTVYVNMAATSLIAGTIKKTKTQKQLLVYIQEMKNKPPMLSRKNGIPEGFEISFLEEIGRRMKRQIVIKDCASLDLDERETIKQKADIIAGVVTKHSVIEAPGGFFFSQHWAIVNLRGGRTEVYFLLREGKKDTVKANSVIETLTRENYLKSLVGAAKSN